MAETVEYALVIMASTIFLAGSVFTYESFTSFESGVQFRAEFQAISTLVSTALVNGSSRASLSLPASTVACSSGTVTIVSGSTNGSIRTGFPCSFDVDIRSGQHVLVFVRSSRLTFSVT